MVKYFDNKIICDLIEEEPKGIISILVCKTGFHVYIGVVCHCRLIEIKLLFFTEWRVSEIWRNLWCQLFGEIRRHPWEPSPFCHVHNFVFLYQILLWRCTELFWTVCLFNLSDISWQMEKLARWWAERSSDCSTMLERSTTMSKVSCLSPRDKTEMIL